MAVGRSAAVIASPVVCVPQTVGVPGGPGGRQGGLSGGRGGYLVFVELQ